MKFHVLTLFPETVRECLQSSILGRAQERNLIQINAVNIRDFTEDKHGRTDDYTYGGGAGMLMQAQPVYDAWKAVSGERKPRTIYVTPQGPVFHQKLAQELAKEEELIFLCGHYEGIDERVLEEIVTDYVSIGDYVLTGGELPAMVMIDAVSRLVPGVLNNEDSARTESFHNDLLEYPQYSRPEVWRGKAVPQVLLSGNHKEIEKWRLEASLKRTGEVRPDLYERYRERQKAVRILLKQKKENIYLINSLNSGAAELIYVCGDGVLGYCREDRTWMLCAENAACGVELLNRLERIKPAGEEILLHNCGALNDIISSRFGGVVYEECLQAVYTGRQTAPVKHRDIRPLSAEQLPFWPEERQEEKDKSRGKTVYGVYEEEEPVGFAELFGAECIGGLYVKPEWRRRRMGTSLTAFLVNRILDQGGIPYAHMSVKNEAAGRLVESMGFYMARRTVFRIKFP